MLLWLATTALAGGGPPNVMVLYNAEVTEAADVAAHYAEQRSLPAGHTCGLTGIDPLIWRMSLEDYQTLIPLSYDLDLDEGDTLEVLAVARSESVTVPRTGWPVAEQRIRSRVEGWTTATVTMVAATELPEEADPPGTGAAEGSEGPSVPSEEASCGCRTSPVGAFTWLPLIALLIRRLSHSPRRHADTSVSRQAPSIRMGK